MSDGEDSKIIRIGARREAEEQKNRRLFVAGKYIEKGLAVLTGGRRVILGKIDGEIPEDGSVGILSLEVKWASREEEVVQKVTRFFWCSGCGVKTRLDDPELLNKTSIMKHCPICCKPGDEKRFFRGGKAR